MGQLQWFMEYHHHSKQYTCIDFSQLFTKENLEKGNLTFFKIEFCCISMHKEKFLKTINR